MRDPLAVPIAVSIAVSIPVRACPLRCGVDGQPIGLLAATTGFALSRNHYALARCGCGKLLYLSPPPSEDDLAAMYVHNKQYGDEYTGEARVDAILAYVRDSLEHLVAKREWDAGRLLRVLEIGAGLAWMCRAAKVCNPRSITVAQDISPEALASCPWVDEYVHGKIDDARLEARGPYDVISMTHVIEHLVDPVATVARCRALLAPDGLIFVTAPHRPRGWSDEAPDLERWSAYSYNHVPAHVQYFSRDSMLYLAAAAGCELVFWSHEHEDGEAFEAWLAAERGSRLRRWMRRAGARVTRQLRAVQLRRSATA